MFQTFTSTAQGELGPSRVKALRAVMATLGVDAVVVPRADEHQGEYVPANAERLKWLTGFTGSAGYAVVTRKAAALMTDGRYTLQAGQQIDTATFEVVDSTSVDLVAWLVKTVPGGGVIGYDPKLHTRAAIEALAKDGAAKGFKLKALARNPVDTVWGRDRPAPAQGAITVQPLEYAGVRPETKIADVQKTLKD